MFSEVSKKSRNLNLILEIAPVFICHARETHLYMCRLSATQLPLVCDHCPRKSNRPPGHKETSPALGARCQHHSLQPGELGCVNYNREPQFPHVEDDHIYLPGFGDNGIKVC